MYPVPAVPATSIRTIRLTSSSLSLVSANIVCDIGQIMSLPSCGPPIPSPADPSNHHGFRALHTIARVRRYISASGDAPRYGSPSRLGTFASSISTCPPNPSTSYAQTVPAGVVATAYCRSARSTSSASPRASAANAASPSTAVAISAICRRLVTASKLLGTRNGSTHASSDGRNPEKISPTGRTGCPYPFSPSVSVGVGDSLWK